jgi:hypothetical protein
MTCPGVAKWYFERSARIAHTLRMDEAGKMRQDQLTVSRLAWDMAQWELHYLRGLFGVLVLEDMEHGRRGKRLRHEYQEACMRALSDPDYRNVRRFASA